MFNNLKLIKGIGPTIEQRLHNAGIHTFASLAVLSAEEIASLISGTSAQQITKQGWIAQARKLVADKVKSKTRQKKLIVSTSRQHYENFTFEFLLDEKNKARRLRIVHIQSGDVDTWAKWDAERLLDFLARHTGSRLPCTTAGIDTPIKRKPTSDPSLLIEPSSQALAESTSTLSVSLSSLASESIPQAPVSAHTITSAIAHQQETSPQAITSSGRKMRLLEWKLLLGNTDQSVSRLSPDQAFDVRLSLDLINAALPDGSSLDFNGTLYAKRISESQRHMLSETQRTVPYAKIMNLTFYNARLSEGYYRLEALIAFKFIGTEAKSQPGLIAFLEVGLLQVC